LTSIELANEVGLKKVFQIILTERSLIKQKTEYSYCFKSKRIKVINVNGQNVVPEIYDVKRKIKAFEIIAEENGYTVFTYCKYWYWRF
jgi:glucose-6-phosphate isomerase